MSEKVKQWLIKWLGIDELKKELIKVKKHNESLQELVNIGIDVNIFQRGDPHQIYIMSPLNGGTIRSISAYFENMRDLNLLVEELKERYESRDPIFDAPPHFNQMLRDERKHRGMDW